MVSAWQGPGYPALRLLARHDDRHRVRPRRPCRTLQRRRAWVQHVVQLALALVVEPRTAARQGDGWVRRTSHGQRERTATTTIEDGSQRHVGSSTGHRVSTEQLITWSLTHSSCTGLLRYACYAIVVEVQLARGRGGVGPAGRAWPRRRGRGGVYHVCAGWRQHVCGERGV